MRKVGNSIAFITALFLLLAIQTGSAATVVSGSSGKSVSYKEENIYALLDNNGLFKNAFVVNAFKVEEPGIIEDYGDYDLVKNLTTTEKLEVIGDKISVSAPAGMFYYQGNTSKMELPWKITIRYTLDGKEVTPEELPGVEGNLQIDITISKNTGVQGYYATHYALQTMVTLDSEVCTWIEAKGASIINSGKNKIVSFTLLPAQEADYSISAKVAGFYMNGIQFSGIPLSISGIKFDGGSVFTGELSKLTDGIGEIEKGAAGISAGVEDLKEGAGKFHNGMKNMQSGIGQINDSLKKLTAQNSALKTGMGEIADGLSAIIKGLEGFNVSIEGLEGLTGASGEINAGISELASGLAQLKGSFEKYEKQLAENKLYADSIIEANNMMIQRLNGQIAEMEKQLSMSVPGTENYNSIKSGIQLYQQLSDLLQGNAGLIFADREFIKQLEAATIQSADGAVALKDNYARFDEGISSIPSMLESLPDNIAMMKNSMALLKEGCDRLNEGIKAYMDGAAEISNGQDLLDKNFRELVKGSWTLYDGICTLYEGTKELADGAQLLKKGTSSMDGGIEDTIEELLESFTGGNFQTVSFMSDKNESVRTVQFVMQTQGIREKDMEKKAVPEVKEKHSDNFWKRLLALFGL